MNRLVTLGLILVSFCELMAVPAWYSTERRQFLAKERMQSTGSKLTLTNQERIVNKILMTAKKSEIDSAIYNSTIFLPSLHFFKSRPLLNHSRVFQIIKQMPKGAALHLHIGSIVSIDWLVKNVTYRPNCYMCVKNRRIAATGFFLTKPSAKDCVWMEIAQERAKSLDVPAFDHSIYQNLTVTVDDPDVVYPEINAIWNVFEQFFGTVHGMISYRPVYEDYMYRTLQEFHDDNVQYLETRFGSSLPYELNGTVHDHPWLLQRFRNVIQRFKQDYPDFSGAKYIFSAPKHASLQSVLQDVRESIQEFRNFPDIFLGFDLVQQEDTTPELLFFINGLLYPFAHHRSLPFYFHAGETDWLDIHDDNLIDAILLNTTRIGHGFGVTKHPEVMRIVKERNIPIEVNPISNQVLKLVADLRNHPASVLLAQDFPICISSDDPAVWEALPLSHDFYMAFMALAGADDDLRFLKQLAINSINFSGMTSTEKTAAFQLWQIKWQQFITHVIRTYDPLNEIVIG